MEGTKLQLVSEGGQTESIIVSTLAEAWKVVDGGLVSGGVVKDVGSSFLHPDQSPEERVRLDPVRIAGISQQAG